MISGDLTSKLPASFIVELRSPSDANGASVLATGRLDVSHLADHPSAMEAMASVIKPGCKIGEERLGGWVVDDSYKHERG